MRKAISARGFERVHAAGEVKIVVIFVGLCHLNKLRD
ncbi:Uncharacterised protein [Vibrio cholerae]|nr:Uncharacterised protein [Vibrio cholerae]